MTENRSIALLSTGKEMFLTEQTVLTIKVCFSAECLHCNNSFQSEMFLQEEK